MLENSKEKAFEFYINLIDVFSNVNKEDEIYIEEFEKYLAALKTFIYFRKEGLIDFKEFDFLAENRINKGLSICGNSQKFKYSFSELLNRDITIWIYYLNSNLDEQKFSDILYI